MAEDRLFENIIGGVKTKALQGVTDRLSGLKANRPPVSRVPDSQSINEFITQIAKNNGFYNNAFFLVTISPTGDKPRLEGSDTRSMSFLCHRATLPGFQIETIDNVIYSLNYETPVGVRFDPLWLDMYIDNNFTAYKAIMAETFGVAEPRPTVDSITPRTTEGRINSTNWSPAYRNNLLKVEITAFASQKMNPRGVTEAGASAPSDNSFMGKVKGVVGKVGDAAGAIKGTLGGLPGSLIPGEDPRAIASTAKQHALDRQKSDEEWNENLASTLKTDDNLPVLARYTLHNCFIKAIQQSPLDWGSGNTIASAQVEISYEYYTSDLRGTQSDAPPVPRASISNWESFQKTNPLLATAYGIGTNAVKRTITNSPKVLSNPILNQTSNFLL